MLFRSILTNRDKHGRKGTIVAIVKGTTHEGTRKDEDLPAAFHAFDTETGNGVRKASGSRPDDRPEGHSRSEQDVYKRQLQSLSLEEVLQHKERHYKLHAYEQMCIRDRILVVL